jgi:dTDP-4-dehydrorhamnose reductase
MFSEPEGHANPNADANAQRNINQLAYSHTDPQTIIHTPAYPAVCQAVSHHPICHSPLQ